MLFWWCTKRIGWIVWYKVNKNGVKMKRWRTEKTVRRSFIYMEKASKIAVKQKQWLSPQDCLLYTNGLEVALQPLLRCPKYGGVTPYFDRCAILASLHLPPAALGDEARHALASDKFCLTKKKQSPNGNCFFLAGAEGLGLACRLGRCFCTSCRGLHRRPAPLNTLRVPRSLNHFTQF